MRIRSVFSWQRRHDIRKNSLIWLIDFAFVLCAYMDYSATLLFTSVPLGIVDPTIHIPYLTPQQIGSMCHSLEAEMFQHSYLPFYMKTPPLVDSDMIYARTLANTFCENITPPVVTMDSHVRETRGMSREDKKVDFMTPWLQSISCQSCPAHCHCPNAMRWYKLVCGIVQRKVADIQLFKKEVCQIIVNILLTTLSVQTPSDEGYIYDIAPATAVEQSERELLVFVRIPGTKRKRTVSRRTFRGDLDVRISQFCHS